MSSAIPSSSAFADVGEAGCVGAMPVMMNAVIDALSPLGIRDLDMPASPARIWAAIQNASRNQAERLDRKINQV